MKEKIKTEIKRKVVAVILTGGEGKRFATSAKVNLPKQFFQVHEKPLFIHCILKYSKIKEIDDIFLVINSKWRKEYEHELKKHNINNVMLVNGGQTRLLSIISAMNEIKENPIIILHNGVNPSTSLKLIKKCIKTAYLKKAVTAYIPSFFTNILINQNEVLDTIERKKIGYTTDPQVYLFNVLKAGVDLALKNGLTDKPTVQLVKNTGQRVYIVKSDEENVKVTLKHDIKVVEAVLNPKKD